MSARLGAFVLAGVLVAAGVAHAQTGAKPATKAPTATAPVKPSPGAGPIIVVETEKGTFEFETYPNEAPKTVEHIVGLVRKRFYNGLRVHRMEPGFVVQMGDPYTRDMTKRDMWGTGGSGSKIGVGEVSKLHPNIRGAVGIAHNGDPRTADSQFYVLLSAQPRLNADYPIFGKVLTGMEVVSKLQIGDRIVRATVKEAK